MSQLNLRLMYSSNINRFQVVLLFSLARQGKSYLLDAQRVMNDLAVGLNRWRPAERYGRRSGSKRFHIDR